jgi:23S rRNA C2498 (ribose-2'-O)-methylase RlmM
MEVIQENDQYVIRIPQSLIDAAELDKLLRELRYRTLLAGRQGTEAEADQLAREIGQGWWTVNKDRFLR